jgi:hypothetical protein
MPILPDGSLIMIVSSSIYNKTFIRCDVAMNVLLLEETGRARTSGGGGNAVIRPGFRLRNKGFRREAQRMHR